MKELGTGQSGARYRRAALCLLAVSVSSGLAVRSATAEPPPPGAVSAEASLPGSQRWVDPTEYGFNEGDTFRLSTAETLAVLRAPGAGLWAYDDADWSKPDRPGSIVFADRLADDVPGGRLSTLVEGYRADLDGDGRPEVILMPRASAVRPRGRAYAPVVLTQPDRTKPWVLWARLEALPGERFRVEDIRDHDGDGRPEVILSGRVGSTGFYIYYSIWGVDSTGVLVRHLVNAPDTLHLVDLEQKKRYQMIRRRVVARQGPVRHWTEVDRVFVWDGSRFSIEPRRYSSYHEQVTKRKLVDDLIDSAEADPFILRNKVSVLRQVHTQVLPREPIRVPEVDLLERVRRLRRSGRADRIEGIVVRELEQNPHDTTALLLLAEEWMADKRFGAALGLLYRALGVDPEDGALWHAAGTCFAGLQERSSATGCFIHSVLLVNEPEARRKKLQKSMETADDESVRMAIEAALSYLDETLANAAARPVAEGEAQPPDEGGQPEKVPAIDPEKRSAEQGQGGRPAPPRTAPPRRP